MIVHVLVATASSVRNLFLDIIYVQSLVESVYYKLIKDSIKCAHQYGNFAKKRYVSVPF